jgi:hypothetical protein
MAELGSCFNRHAKRGEHDNGTRNLIDICNPKFRNKVQDLDKPGTSGRKKQPLPPFLPDSIGLNRPTSPQYLLKMTKKFSFQSQGENEAGIRPKNGEK